MPSTDNIYNFSVHFTDEQKESILNETGGISDQHRKDEFFTYLETIARDFVIDKSHDKQPTPSDIKRDIQIINRAAKKINNVFGTNQNIYQINNYIFVGIHKIISKNDLDGRNPLTAQSAIRNNLILLEEASDSALENLKENKKAKRSDDPIQSLFYRLCVIWSDYSEKKPGTSVGSPTSNSPGKVGGPFIRFIKEYFNAILGSMSPEFKSSYPDIVSQFQINNEAIRYRIRDVKYSKLDFG